MPESAAAPSRMAGRHGCHRPVHIAIGLALCGALLAVASTPAAGAAHFGLLCASAACVGSGANMGLIVIQRTAGQAVTTHTERMRVFSWLGMAPSLSNVVGPVAAGFMIDASGFRAAYALMLALPLLMLWCTRLIPHDPPLHRSKGQAARCCSA